MISLVLVFLKYIVIKFFYFIIFFKFCFFLFFFAEDNSLLTHLRARKAGDVDGIRVTHALPDKSVADVLVCDEGVRSVVSTRKVYVLQCGKLRSKCSGRASCSVVVGAAAAAAGSRHGCAKGKAGEGKGEEGFSFSAGHCQAYARWELCREAVWLRERRGKRRG